VPRTECLTVPLGLAPGGGNEPAELWVLPGDSAGQLDELVRSADDQLLGRLSFGVGQAAGRQTVVLRARPSKLPPPVLALEGAWEFRPFQRLPNLFLPCKLGLHPPLRRDAVRKLLAEDPEQITWLYPHPDGTFTPESLPDQAFRPLADWIDYVLDHDREALQAWIQSAQFDFERFVCPDEKQPEKITHRAERDPRPRTRAAEPSGGGAKPDGPAREKRARNAAAEGATPLFELADSTPSELEKRKKALEDQFLALEGTLDAPERLALWPQLAGVYAALQNSADATVCWVNALWEGGRDAAKQATAWAHAEWHGMTGRRFAAQLDQLLVRPQPSPPDLRALAALVIRACYQERPEPALLARLNDVRQHLQRHEGLLPVRAVWLAWAAVGKLSGGDVLALARARDRLLERLYRGGLSVELDLPSFLRFTGSRSSERFRAFRDWFLTLPERIGQWVHALYAQAPTWPTTPAKPRDTEGYADLILAFGLARVGEATESRRCQERARELLGKCDPVHTWLLEAFGHRIEQARDGRPPGGPLPAPLLEGLEGMERLPRYSIEKLREYSRILEPEGKLEPHRRFLHHTEELDRRLNELPDLIDRREIEEEIRELLRAHAGEGAAGKRAQVVLKGVELAPRVGQAFALALLERVPEADAVFAREAASLEPQAASDPKASTRTAQLLVQRAALLEKAVFVAAHFGQSAQVQVLLGLLREVVGRLGASEEELALEALATLAGQSFRGLRRLGLRDEIHGLLEHLTGILRGGGGPADLLQARRGSVVLRCLLHVAAGWLYFGRDEEARPLLETARALLYQGGLSSIPQIRLACAYVSALGQAPVELALRSIDELFGRLHRLHDGFASNSHYSLAQLSVVEAVVLAVVSEDFALGTTARRWLDEEEFLVRRRIHRDLQAALEEHRPRER
jgi:hypothetical protein